ncbi:MAG: type II toxin-antitoxin system VapC family toxin [Roseimicrobium sp.]
MNVLLDSSFVIDLLNEIASQRPGDACAWLRSNRRAKLWVSAVTVAEVLEGAEDMDAVREFLSRFRWQGLHQSHAARAALLQRRAKQRMGENDAWQAAVAMEMRGKLVGHDPKAFTRLGELYCDHRAPSTP